MFGGICLCSYHVRGVDGSCAKHLTIESYTVVILLTVILIIISIPSLPHSFISGWKPSFPANPSHRSLSFLIQDWLHWFPRLFTVTSEDSRFYLLVFLFYTCWFRAVPQGGSRGWLVTPPWRGSLFHVSCPRPNSQILKFHSAVSPDPFNARLLSSLGFPKSPLLKNPRSVDV